MPTVQTYSGAVYPSSGQAYSSVVNVNGQWNATTNSPALANGVGIENYAYRVSVAGSTSLDGISDWNVDDFVIFSGGRWRKLTGKEIDVSALSGGGTGVLSALANPVNSANGVVVQDASGNVGIGTTSPQSKLMVQTTGTFSGAGTLSNAGLHLTSNNVTGGYAGQSIVWSNYGTFGSSITAYIAALTYGNYLMTFSSNGFSEHMRIDFNGNVGIGTTSPNKKLEVVGGSNSAIISIASLDGTLSRLGLSNPSRYWSISNYGSALSNAFAISDETAGTTRFLIDASGNVGLGLVDPTEKLDIQGNAIRLRTAKTPASATATGTQGQVCWDSNYVYVCVATNTWKRAALSTW